MPHKKLAKKRMRAKKLTPQRFGMVLNALANALLFSDKATQKELFTLLSKKDDPLIDVVMAAYKYVGEQSTTSHF